MHKIYEASPNYTEVSATIWLSKGDHFFFFCDEVLEAGAKAALDHNALCALQSMKTSYPPTDTVNLHIRALRCDSIEAQETPRASYDRRWFYSQCVPKTESPTADGGTSVDHRPVIYVNGAEFYFNITKSAIFEDVIFDGVNAFGEVHVNASELRSGEHGDRGE